MDGGYTVYSPDKSAIASTNAISDSSGLYFQMSVTHEVTDHLGYSLYAGHSVDYSYNGQPFDRYFVRLNPNWNFIRRWTVGATFSWEQGTQVGFHGLSYDQYNFGCNLDHLITKKLSAGIHYRRVMETSNQSSLNFDENIFGLKLDYRF